MPASIDHTTLPEGVLAPHVNDTKVYNAATLHQLFLQARDTALSLHLVGHIKLGSLPHNWLFGTILLTSHPTTLWSKDGATLDCEGSGRCLSAWRGNMLLKNIHFRNGATESSQGGGACLWVERSWVRIIGSSFTNCVTNASTQGGALNVNEGRVEIEASSFKHCRVTTEGQHHIAMGGAAGGTRCTLTMHKTTISDCHVTAIGAWAFGGGVGVWDSSTVILTQVDFVGTSVSSLPLPGSALEMSSVACGGGFGMSGGSSLKLHHSTFRDTVAISYASGPAYGGALALGHGQDVLDVYETTLSRARAFAPDGVAYGGCLGLLYGSGVATVYDSVLRECTADGGVGGFGGSIGSSGDGRVSLGNVSIEEGRASVEGMAIYAPPHHATAAILSIRHTCYGPSSTGNAALVATDGDGGLLLRNLVVDTDGCTESGAPPLTANHSRLLQCDDPQRWQAYTCGQFAVCVTSSVSANTSSVPSFATPLCRCPSTGHRRPFEEWAPSPLAHSPVLAPYFEGCYQPPVGSLELRQNWWRLSTNTSDVRTCLQEWHPHMPTPCLGGHNAAEYCAPGLAGPLCSVCLQPGHYFSTEAAACLPCSATVLPYVGVSLGAVGALGLAFIAWYYRRQWCGTALDRWANAWARATFLIATYGLVPKVKILLGYYQIVLAMPEAFAVPMPPAYLEWMSYARWVSFDWFALAFPAAQCIGTLSQRMTLIALAPLAPLVLILCGAALLGVAGARPPLSRLACARHAVLRTLPFALFLLFALVPGVSSHIFAVFSCEAFGETDAADATEIATSRAFVASDLSMQCAGDEYHRLTALAGVFIVLWPLGVPCAFLALLATSHPPPATRESHPSDESRAAELTRATRFLHAEYTSQCREWELLELARKLFLTGGVFLIPQRLTLFRLVLAILLSLTHLVALLTATPYRQRSNALAAVATAVTLICTLLLALLVRVTTQIDSLLAASQLSVVPFGGLGIHSDPVALSVAIFLFNIFAVLLAAGLLAREAASERARVAHERRWAVCTLAPPTFAWEARRPFACFLSHYKKEASADARYLHDLLRRMLCSRVFLDSSELSDLRGLLTDGLQASDVLVVLLTRGLLTRPWCLLEITAAFQRQQPTVLLTVQGGGFDTREARALVRCLPEALPSEAIALLHSHLGLRLAGLTEAVEALTDRVVAGDVIPWDACVGDAQMVAQAQRLIEAMAICSGQPIRWLDEVRGNDEAARSELAGGRAVLLSCVRHDCAAHARVLQTSLSMRMNCPVLLGGRDDGKAVHGTKGGGASAHVAEVPPASDGDKLVDDHSFNRKRHQDNATTAAERSEACVLLLTKNVLSEASCLMDAYHAVALGKPLVTVTLSGFGYDFGAVASALETLGETLDAQGQEALALQRSCKAELGVDATEMQQVLASALPNIIAIGWDPTGGAHHLAAVVEEVARRLPARRESTSCTAVVGARGAALGCALKRALGRTAGRMVGRALRRASERGLDHSSPPTKSRPDDGTVLLRSRVGTPIVRGHTTGGGGSLMALSPVSVRSEQGSIRLDDGVEIRSI